MWLLECNDNLFNDKKIWLRPGKSIMLGRTGHSTDPKSPSAHKIDIEHKSVSRQHIVITIAALKPGSGTKLRSRSDLRIRDCSKKGTVLDGARFTDETKILDRDKHVFSLGNDPRQYHITWRPCVFTITFPEKHLQAGGDSLLKPYTDKLEQLDIKAVIPFLTDATTHVITSKRNVPKGLCALVHARHIVTDAFVDKLIAATISPGFEDDGATPIRSPLEWDFEGNWPSAVDYVPAPGKEPHPRPAQHFAPIKERHAVFEGFTFIFADEVQFENLEAPLTGGGAKCSHIRVEPGKTTAKAFAEKVRSHSGKKGVDPGSPRGVVVVRLSNSKDAALQDWNTRFIEDVDAELGQKSVSQNAFLDAILTQDSSSLKQPLEEEVERIASTEPPPQRADMGSSHQQAAQRQSVDDTEHRNESEAHEQGSSAPSRPKKASWRDRKKMPVFKGFDNFSDEEPDGSELMVTSTANDGTAPRTQGISNDSQGLFVPEDDHERTAAEAGRRSKRGLPTDEQQLDDLLPASRALKRRRLERGEDADSENKGVAPDKEGEESVKESVAAAKQDKSAGKRIETSDLRNSARSHAKARDRRSNGKITGAPVEEDDDEDAGDLSEIAKKLVIEEMDVPQRRAKPQRRQAAGGERWKEEWNGRKNFKKFRRRGEAAANRGQRVIVRVEAVGDDEESRDSDDDIRGGSLNEEVTETQHNVDEHDSDSGVSLEGSSIGGTTAGTTGPRGTKRAAATQSQRSPAKKAKGSSVTAASRRPGRKTATRRDEDSESSSSSEEDGLKFKLRR